MRLFPEKIHQLREEKNLFQKDLAEVLSIDTPAYCRIEKGERRARRDQVITLARYLNEDKEEFLTLWLADQVSVVLSTDIKIAKRVLSLADQSING
ncbi:MAG: helix-turn-helix domain-containing protein [Bacteroidales bacterium]|jgi:transcriptional regulator with XRE-family HTH domain|nr:helix-turn-helix domain-containing protein [Bacteroidales bacterium]